MQQDLWPRKLGGIPFQPCILADRNPREPPIRYWGYSRGPTGFSSIRPVPVSSTDSGGLASLPAQVAFWWLVFEFGQGLPRVGVNPVRTPDRLLEYAEGFFWRSGRLDVKDDQPTIPQERCKLFA